MTTSLSQPAPEQAVLLNVSPSEKPQVAAPAAPPGAGFICIRPFREWNPNQQQLLPQDLRAALGEGHLACFFVELAGVLDFGPILRSYTEDCGQPPYHPVMMALLLMYAYAVGVTSSREIERRCGTDLAFRYISAGEQPDHDTTCAFRVRHLEVFKELFRQTLQVAREMGTLKLGHIAIDGTKLKANASKHKAMSYGRMDEAMKKLDEQVDQLLAEAAAIDEEENQAVWAWAQGRRAARAAARSEAAA